MWIPFGRSISGNYPCLVGVDLPSGNSGRFITSSLRQKLGNIWKGILSFDPEWAKVELFLIIVDTVFTEFVLLGVPLLLGISHISELFPNRSLLHAHSSFWI
jgi:hypothetical protein